MAITFVQYHDANVAAGTSITLNVPAGAAAGDLLLAFIHTAGTRVTASATDFGYGSNKWKPLTIYVTNPETIRPYVYYRIMQSGDTSWAFTTTANARTQGAIVAYNESGTAKWMMSQGSSTLMGQEDPESNTATAPPGYVYDGLMVYGTFAYRAGGTITDIAHDQGTGRLEVIDAASTFGMKISDDISTTAIDTTLTSTVTVATGTVGDHIPFMLTVQSSATGDLYDPADLIDATWTRTSHVYKGRDTAADDTVGAA